MAAIQRKLKRGGVALNLRGGEVVTLKGYDYVEKSNIYLNYDTNSLAPKTLKPSKTITVNSLWVVEKNPYGFRLKTYNPCNIYYNGYYHTEYGYLDIYDAMSASSDLKWWGNSRDQTKQIFTITPDNSLFYNIGGIQRHIFYLHLKDGASEINNFISMSSTVVYTPYNRYNIKIEIYDGPIINPVKSSKATAGPIVKSQNAAVLKKQNSVKSQNAASPAAFGKIKSLNKFKKAALAITAINKLKKSIGVKSQSTAALPVYKSQGSAKKTVEMTSTSSNDKPLVIYLVGKESGAGTRSYLCTFLRQIDVFKKTCGIDNDRINLIYGQNGSAANNYEHTCYNSYEKDAITDPTTKRNKPIPFGIDVNYITSNYTPDNLFNTIRNILAFKANPNTPIIFLYDGHGPTNSGLRNGNIIIRDNLHINEMFLKTLFSGYENNAKLFLFSQCGSFDFAERFYSALSTSDKSVMFSTTNEPNVCAYGFKLIRSLTDMIETGRYSKFSDIYDSDRANMQNRLRYKTPVIRVNSIFKNI